MAGQGHFLTGRASALDYPSPDGSPVKTTYTSIIAYIVGGCTYEESAFVETINKRSPQPTAATPQRPSDPSQPLRPSPLCCCSPSPSGVRVILGGSCVHNSTSSAPNRHTTLPTIARTILSPHLGSVLPLAIPVRFIEDVFDEEAADRSDHFLEKEEKKVNR